VTRGIEHHVIQAGLLAFGAAGAWLISAPAGSPWILHGFGLLLVSQLFWLLDVFRTRPLRWGVLVNVLIYTAVWIRGFYNYF
jgi:hypothetical protein